MSIREHVSSVLCVYACVAFLVPRYDLPFPSSFVDANAVLGWHRPLLHRRRSSLSSSPHLVQLWPPGVPELALEVCPVMKVLQFWPTQNKKNYTKTNTFIFSIHFSARSTSPLLASVLQPIQIR